jgi:NTE family protein
MKRKTIGLALSGGGARGFAHVGVVKVLAEHAIPIDFISGTSVGSVVGGALATGMSANEIETMAHNVRWRNMTRPSLSPIALLSNAPMGKFIRRRFPVERFDDLLKPLAVVACDLKTSERVVMKESGDLVTAIRASCAVPAVFAPIRSNGRILIDGGVLDPLPVDAVRELGAEIVIAVDLLSSGATFHRMPTTAMGMLFKSAMILLRAASNSNSRPADITIIPDIAHIRPDRLGQRRECQNLGETAAREAIEKIKEMING